ncbi:MAG TPA: hypothetical protein VLB12_12475 [Gemmatimonadales bacterium]|nr:hypothetical protein [Gemmatimonadales bacterium]
MKLRYPVSDTMDTELTVFVEDGGVRFDNAGPVPANQIPKLIDWLHQYMTAVQINKWKRRRNVRS